jgi:penicillin-binding protein 1C
LRNDSPATEERRLLGENESWLIADILSDNQAREMAFGSHSVLRLPFKCAVKTGTSSTFRDNWTLGFTREFTVGVWVGNFDNTPMQDVSGITGAGPIFRDVMLHLHEKQPASWFDRPAAITHARIDPRTGKRLTPHTPPSRLSREEFFIAEKMPPVAQASDYDARGRAILPREYAAWIPTSANWLGDLITLAETDAKPALRITNPDSRHRRHPRSRHPQQRQPPAAASHRRESSALELCDARTSNGRRSHLRHPQTRPPRDRTAR